MAYSSSTPQISRCCWAELSLRRSPWEMVWSWTDAPSAWMAWKYAGSSCRKLGRRNIVTGMCCSRRKSVTAGSRTIPSSIVKNTTGLGVDTREMTGATAPPWRGAGVGGGGVVVVVVGGGGAGGLGTAGGGRLSPTEGAPGGPGSTHPHAPPPPDHRHEDDGRKAAQDPPQPSLRGLSPHSSRHAPCSLAPRSAARMLRGQTRLYPYEHC